MKTIYYIDENCRDKLELMPALRDILLHEGAQDVKVAVTASEFFHHTGFRAEDKDIYFDSKQASNTSARRAFLTRHKDMMEILPVYEKGYAAEHEEVFLRLIAPFLRKENPEQMPPEVESEVRRNAAHVIAKYTPELTTEDEPKEALARRVELCITPGDPASKRHDAAIIAACMRSGKLLNILKKREQERFDSELPELLSEFIGPGRNKELPQNVQAEVLENATHIFSHVPARVSPQAVDETIDIAIRPGDAKQQERNQAIVSGCKLSPLMRRLVKTRHSDRFQALYAELISSCLQPDSRIDIPEDIKRDVQKHAAEAIKQTAPHLTTPEEKPGMLAKRIELKLLPGEEHAEMNQILIAACRQSEAMRRFIKNNNAPRFDALFEELLNTMLSNGSPLPADVQTEIRRNATPAIHRIEGKSDLPPAPIMNGEVPELSIDSSDASRSYHDSVIIEACRQSKLLVEFMKKHSRNYTVLTDDLADREMFSFIKKHLKPAGPESEPQQPVRFVVVTDDEPFAEKLNKHLFKGSSKDSVCMGSDEFLDFCEGKIAQLRAQAASLQKQTVKSPHVKPAPGEASPQADTAATQPPVRDTKAAAEIATSLALAGALQQQHVKLHRIKPQEATPVPTAAQQDEPEKRRRKLRRVEQDDTHTIRTPTARPLVQKRVPKPQAKPAQEQEAPPSHEPDPMRLGWHEQHAYLMSLTPQQRAAKGLQTPRDEYAKGLSAMQDAELCYIKRFDSIADMQSQSPHPYFTIAKRMPRADSVEFRTGELCRYIAQTLSGDYQQTACKALSTVLNFEGDAALTPENLQAHTAAITARINKHYISKSVSFEAFLKKLAEPLGQLHPLRQYTPPAADRPLPSGTACLIKEQVPKVVREVLAEEMKLSAHDLDKITISEHGGQYRVELPGTLEASPQDTRKSAGLTAKRISRRLGVKVRNYQQNLQEAFSQPVLFIPKSVSSALGTSEHETPAALRDMIQMSLGLKDEQMASFGISTKEDYFRVRIPALTSHYDASTGDPEFTGNTPLHSSSMSQREVAEALSETMGIALKNTENSAIFERDFAFRPQKTPAPVPVASPPPAAPNAHQPDPNRLGFFDAMAHARSLPAKDRAALAADSDELAAMKRGAVIFAKVPTAAPAALATSRLRPKAKSKQIETQDKIVPGDTVAPYFYFPEQVTRRHAMSHSNDLVEQKSNELVRDLLAFALGLHEQQVEQFKVERSATPGLLKVRLPSLVFHYDEKTDEPVPAAGEGIRSETFTPEQVAQLLSSSEVLGVPLANSPDSASVDSRIKLPTPQPRPEPAPPAPDLHASDPNRLPFHEKFAAFRQLGEKQRRAIYRDSAPVQQLYFANIWFLKNGETADPYLFLPQSAKESLGVKTDAEVERIVQDVLRTTLGLKYHQLSSFKLEKAENTQYRMYKMRIRPITYVNDNESPPALETLSALQVAKLLEESLGTRIVGSISNPNREQNVLLVSPRDWVAPAVKKPQEDEAEKPKPTRMQRFKGMVKHTLNEAAATPSRSYPFTTDNPARTGRMGTLRRIKADEKAPEELFLELPEATTRGFAAFHSTEQKCHDLCDYVASLGADDQTHAIAAMQKVLGIELSVGGLAYAHEPVLAAIGSRYTGKPDAFAEFLDDIRKADESPAKVLANYQPPMHEVSEYIKNLMQTSLDLTDAERDAIAFDIASFKRQPCMVKLPSVAYSAAEPLPGQPDTGQMAEKVFTPEDVAKALNNEFDIAIEGQDTAGSNAHSARHRNSGGKHGR